MTKNTAAERRPFHAVKFYAPAESMAAIIAEYVAQGLLEHQPALIIASLEEREGTLIELRNRQIDVDRARAEGTLLLLDAAEFMSRILVRGMPDAERFDRDATQAIERMLQGRKDVTLRIYGGMANDLWVSGNFEAASRLEGLWNRLAFRHRFSLLCSYATGPDATSAADRAHILATHSHVVTPRGAVKLLDGADCPACGTPISHAQRTLPGEVVFRCQFCSIELVHQREA